MHRRLKGVGRLIAAPFLALIMLTTGVIATATTAQAADSGAWTFTNPDGTLNATGTSDGAQISVTPGGANYTNWRLISAGTGTFRIANTETGKCLYSTQPLTQRSCGAGDKEDGQLWHFHPIDSKPGTFMLVRADDGYCLDNRGGLHLWGVLAQPNSCNGASAQEWKVPQAKASEALKLALDYYSQMCTKDTSTCSWKQTSEGAPEVLPRVKASSVWYNDTADKVTQVFTTIYHSGWSMSLSSSVSVSAGVSVPVQAMISSQLGSTVAYQSDESQINGVAVTVPPKNYGWVDFAAVGKKVTGTWTFDKNRFPWTTDATVTVPVVDSSAGSTMYVAHASPNPPGTTNVTSADAPALTFATKASFTPDLPDGTIASQDGPNKVKLTDTATGTKIGTIKPSTVVDTEGTTHPVGLTVSGNVITQTIENAPGDTIEGSMTMPSVTYRTTTTPAVKTAGVKPAAFTTMSAQATMRPAFWPIPDREHPKNSDEWNKCMAKELGESMVKGAARAALLGALRGGQLGAAAGPEGAAAGAALGMLSGTVTGLGKAYYVCGTDPG
ncbi:hypothetical protein ABT168_02765 [Streptomyces sp. NPDC001793]|uniref:hypothetical protein n=1 Tax=Streptomyces sp. NPDC001793 TaxID=3154657 RepID=UPI003329D119